MKKELPGREGPDGADHVFEVDNWEVTYEARDADILFEELDFMHRSVMRVGCLKRLPDQFAARVPVDEPDENGDHEDFEWRFFDTEAEARAAAWPKEDNDA